MSKTDRKATSRTNRGAVSRASRKATGRTSRAAPGNVSRGITNWVKRGTTNRTRSEVRRGAGSEVTGRTSLIGIIGRTSRRASVRANRGALSRGSRGSVSRTTRDTTGCAIRGQSSPTSVTMATTTYNCSINVACEEDIETCLIKDFAILNTDQLVVIYYNTKTVNLIDTSMNRIITSYNTPSDSWRVSALSTDMIAVTLILVGKIQLLKVTSSSFNLEREIKVKGACLGIAHKDGKLAVGYSGRPGRVEILNTRGKVLHRIEPQDSTDTLVLQRPEYILFGRDSDTVIVSDFTTNKVCVITFSGQMLHTYIHRELNEPRGIVMSEEGLLFVCSWRNECIHVVSEDFMSSKVIINQDKHVVCPDTIRYCAIKNKLYISNCERSGKTIFNQIHVYDLNNV